MVVFGKSSYSSVEDYSTLSASQGVIIKQTQGSTEMGQSMLVVKDVDGDGKDDLVIGDKSNNGNGY
jgi:hypothetical protein